jgi:predicted TIM-barrel fold metal-dependent hydrolase
MSTATAATAPPLIIDCHCHCGSGDGLRGPWDTAAPLTRYLKWAAGAGVTRTNLFSVFHSNYEEANRVVARWVARDPQRFYGFAFVNPVADAGRVARMVAEAVERLGFCGIKVHRHDARITREICDVARSYQLPVLYDVMGETSVVELLAREYPEVDFVIPHMGSFSDDWRAQLSMIDLMERHPNVYTDTSGIRRFDLLEQGVERAGPEKFLYGSDGPWLHPGVELSKVYALRLSPAEQAGVLAGNFLSLISKVRRGRPAPPPPSPRPSPAVPAAIVPAQGELRDPWQGEQFPVG